MSLIFAELGVEVHLYDLSQDTINSFMKTAEETGLGGKLKSEEDYEKLCKSLQSPRVFFLSLPYGSVGDKTVDSLLPYLEKGDIIIDASNENYQSTERRQKKLDPHGVHFIGMGVSRGYQSAHHGPSMSPGGNKEAVEKLLSFLKESGGIR